MSYLGTHFPVCMHESFDEGLAALEREVAQLARDSSAVAEVRMIC